MFFNKIKILKIINRNINFLIIPLNEIKPVIAPDIDPMLYFELPIFLQI